jgi:hypothetical protein
LIKLAVSKASGNARMKLCQNGTFLVIRLAAAMAWIKQRTAEYRITNNEFRRMESLRSISFKKDRIHSFDPPAAEHSLFDAYNPPLEDSLFLEFLFRCDRPFFGRRRG